VTQTLHLPQTIARDVPPPTPPRQPRWTPAVLTQLAVILAVLVAGVAGAAFRGSPNDSKDVLSVVQAASTTASTAKSYRATIDMTMDVSGQHIVATGEVLADLAKHRQSGFFEIPGFGRMNVVQLGQRGFFQLPNGRTDAAGHHWVSVTVPNASAQAAVGGQDPTAFFKLLADPDDVKTIGDEDVNDTRTTHYRVKLDPQRITELGAKALGTTLPAGAADAIKNLYMDIWLDADNRPRRMSMQIKQDSISVVMTFNFLDYDGPVTVTEPPAADVTTVGSIAELGPLMAGAPHA
jgi:hypothetical protein